MSDSSIGLNPVIDEPSKPIPPSNASSSSEELIENDFSCPSTSVNQRRMKRTSRSRTAPITSSAVCGRSPASAIGEAYPCRPTPEGVQSSKFASRTYYLVTRIFTGLLIKRPGIRVRYLRQVSN